MGTRWCLEKKVVSKQSCLGNVLQSHWCEGLFCHTPVSSLLSALTYVRRGTSSTETLIGNGGRQPCEWYRILLLIETIAMRLKKAFQDDKVPFALFQINLKCWHTKLYNFILGRIWVLSDSLILRDSSLLQSKLPVDKQKKTFEWGTCSVFLISSYSVLSREWVFWEQNSWH